MDAIWIIIVIIAVIMRFLKIEDFKGKLPEDWGDKKIPPIFKDWEFPWDDEPELDEEIPKKRPVRMQNEVLEQGGSPGENQSATAYDVKEPHLESTDTAFGGHPLLTSDTIITGIIMSELLQPPKSKRPGWRNN